MVTIRPLGNRVLVKRSKAKTTKGGIILPDSAKEKPKEGEVVAIGPGKVDDEGRALPLQVRLGDTVLFNAYAGIEVKEVSKDEEHLIMSEDDILAVLR